MPLSDTDLKYIWDMWSAAQEVAQYVDKIEQSEYLDDRMRQRAVERTIEVIGEAARNVSDDARRTLEGVQWGAIVGTRHILAHEYGEIDHNRIWRIATTHVPTLLNALATIVEQHPPDPDAQRDPAEP